LHIGLLEKAGQQGFRPRQVIVVRHPYCGVDVQRQLAGSPGEVVAENGGSNSVLIEQVMKKLGFDAISGLIQTPHSST